MHEDVMSHYGTWWAVALWVIMYCSFLLFIPFYRKAQRKPAGVFAAFIVAFALEMFGAPLSLYFVMWAFGRKLPEGILWGHTLVSFIGNGGMYLAITATLAGGALIVAGWARIHRDYWSKTEGEGRLVDQGIYRWIRHPQYTGFLVIALGVLCEWATIPLLVLWPVLAIVYTKLARREEAEMEERFGAEWIAYRNRTGMFLPRLFASTAAVPAAVPAAGPEAGKTAATTRPGKSATLHILPAALLLAFSGSGRLLSAAPLLSGNGTAQGQYRTLSRNAAFTPGGPGIAWTGSAGAGLGLSLAGSKLRPTMNFESSIILGSVELGTMLGVLPLEFGSPDLIQAGAIRYGTSIAVTAPLGEGGFRTFARLGLGGLARARADGNGAFNAKDAEKFFNTSISAGIDIPVGNRWSTRIGGTWHISPDAEDYEGKALGGLELGIMMRFLWETRLR